MQSLEGRLLIAEGLEERERELLGVKRLLGEGGYGLLDLDGVHASPWARGSLVPILIVDPPLKSHERGTRYLGLYGRPSEPHEFPDRFRDFRIAGLDGFGEGGERRQMLIQKWSRPEPRDQPPNGEGLVLGT